MSQASQDSPHLSFATTPGGGGGVLGISSDGDDRRTFLGLISSILGFFGVGKFVQYFFGVA